MAKRKGLSKGTRFEVFKRDRFRCAYCGQSPPVVVLQIDHILPVSQGGNNDIDNLLTACQDCNAGKSDKPLDQIPRPLDDQMADRKEKREQVEEYNRFLAAERTRELETVDRIEDHWMELSGRVPGKVYRWPNDWGISVRTFLKHLPEAEVVDAIDIAFSRHPSYGRYQLKTWRYFCGVCWRRIKGDRPGS